MKFIDAINLIDSLNGKKTLSDQDMEQALTAMANLAPIIKNQDKWSKLQKKMNAYLKANPEQYNVSVQGVLVVSTGTIPATETKWDAEALQADAKATIEFNCEEEFKKYFKAPVAAVNPHACEEADEAFKQKYGVQKTTVEPIINFN